MPTPHRIGAAFRDVRRKLASLVLVEILISALLIAVITPVSSGGLSWLIRRSGEVAVSNTEITGFLSSPLGIGAVLLLLGAGFFAFFVRGAGALRVLAGGEPSGVALGRVLPVLPRLAAVALRQGIGYLAVLLPLAAVGALTIPSLLSEHDINYYLQVKPPRFWFAVGVATVLGVAGAALVFRLFVRWLYAVPVLVFEGRSARESLRRSAELVRAHPAPVVRSLLAWGLAVVLFGAATAFVLGLVTSGLLSWAGASLARLVPILGLLLVVELALAQVVGFLALAVTVALMLHFYREASGGPLEVGAPPRAKRLSSRAVVGIAVGAILVGAVPTLAIYTDLEVKEDVQITAHRGSSQRAPENSLAAIAAAIEDGADYAEIDVQETADGEVVLLHDLDLLRVTGVNRRIWEVELAELQELDAGSWFSPEFADERIPTLQQAIDLAGDEIRLNIELKYNGHEPNLSRRVVEILREKGIGSRCVLSSLSLAGLRAVEALDPELETGLIVGASIGDLTRLDVDFFSVNAAQVSWPLAAGLRDAGKELHAWTVNDTGEMWRLLTLGVDNLITDRPAELVEARTEFAGLSPVEVLLIAFHHRIAG